MRNQVNLKAIWEKTGGRCHFCGDAIKFENRGWAKEMDGHWEVDHVIQRGKGGARIAANCLPACTRCNRLRWHRTGAAIRQLLLLGIIATDEMKKADSRLGIELTRLLKERPIKNESRRIRPKRTVTANG